MPGDGPAARPSRPAAGRPNPGEPHGTPLHHLQPRESCADEPRRDGVHRKFRYGRPGRGPGHDEPGHGGPSRDESHRGGPAACRDDLRSVGPPAPAHPGPGPEGPDFDADFWGDAEVPGGDAEAPVLDEYEDDYTPFHDLGPQAAARLLEVLPEAQLADRQNLAPTLGSLLRACARADGRVRLSGYAIGPRRPDERVTVEALWIADPDLLRMEVHDEHDEDCRCRVLWDAVRERYGLDARALPDEMRPMRRQWTHGQVGTWLWWD